MTAYTYNAGDALRNGYEHHITVIREDYSMGMCFAKPGCLGGTVFSKHASVVERTDGYVNVYDGKGALVAIAHSFEGAEHYLRAVGRL